MTELMICATQDAGIAPITERPNMVALTLAPNLEYNESLAAITWKTLAPLMAAQPTMRLWQPAVRFDESSDLTKALPDKPAAVPIFWMKRTVLMALDLDAKQWGASAVLDDLHALLQLLKDCGARTVVDYSVSGGAHILVPLQRAVTRTELDPVMNALAARFATLDVKPMQGDTGYGCITVPGSRCREGGFRVLKGSLAAATEAFRLPNPPEVLQHLAAEIGADTPVLGDPAVVEDSAETSMFFEGAGARLRLRPTYRLGDEMPDVVAVFASTGKLAADQRWPSASEARLAVLYHAMGRGMCLADVIDRMTGRGPWVKGLGAAFSRYRYDWAISKALKKDWDKAFRHHRDRCRIFHARTHKTLHTGGPLTSAHHKAWLAHAIWWCDITLRSDSRRWSAAAVLQALAVDSLRAGEVLNGTPTVAIGVRSLSLATGLLSKETVAAGLQLLREYPGSPVLLIQEGSWLIPDGYALVTPDVLDPDPDTVGRPELADVHDAWWVIGHHHRRVFELVQAFGQGRAAELAQTARMSLSAVYDSLAELCRRGLLVKDRSCYRLGETSLDDIAELWRVPEERQRRIETYRRERREWKEFVDTVRTQSTDSSYQVQVQLTAVDVVLSRSEEDDYLNSVMATGPPVRDDEMAPPFHRRLAGDIANR
ncbi:hypothetical protein AOT87_12260 [Mycobacteroides sp. H003]|nr:hypothetical protein AOT91_23000 [Mycobacteroides sp. H092]KRQ23455.1 hypothetical protein AOT87_12260 [Mycobacteroides sp. H003]KRQ40264.1 hypothetical protein AOT92_14890 [Mycobacteroides sp. H101]KRQ47423.1 hypothetical protein AOT88_16030 [Mycobacteroides sp. H063]KRQ57712.1 hypothetical protein AOT90_25650 [Mycobacteroides sp. H079]